MQRLRHFFSETILKHEKILLAFIFSFAIVNWFFLVLVEKLGPPDFYKLYCVAEKLYSGDLKAGIIPPLFSLLMYPLGKLLSLFAPSREAFIIAGEIIALAASLGVLWFSYLLLKKITGKWSLLCLVFMVISPWFLKLLSFPITDMLYLFFVIAAFYTFFSQSGSGFSLLAVIGGVLTRFEGVLLILCGIVNYFKLKKRYVYILLGLIPVVLVLFLLFIPRIFDHLKDIILPRKSYLFIFQHPMEFFNVFYGNLLFFIPVKFPYLVKLTALLALFVFFLYGSYRLFKINRSFTVSILIYEALFLVAKGYINPADPEREFRRVFSGIWIFYILTFIGCYFLLKKIKPYTLPKILVLVSGGVFFVAVTVSLGLTRLPLLIPVLLILLPFLYPFKNLVMGKIPKYAAILVLFGFILGVYPLSYDKAERYVVSYANKAAYAAAQWLNHSRFKHGAVVLSYTDNIMIRYYLEKDKEDIKYLQWVELAVPIRYEADRDRFKELLFGLLKENRVEYIISDSYNVQMPEFLAINDVKRLLYEERENTAYFKLKNLFYKRENVGYVLRPVWD